MGQLSTHPAVSVTRRPFFINCLPANSAPTISRIVRICVTKPGGPFIAQGNPIFVYDGYCNYSFGTQRLNFSSVRPLWFYLAKGCQPKNMPGETKITEAALNQQMRDDYEKYAPCLHVSVRVSNSRLQRALERQAEVKGVTVEQCGRRRHNGTRRDQRQVLGDGQSQAAQQENSRQPRVRARRRQRGQMMDEPLHCGNRERSHITKDPWGRRRPAGQDVMAPPEFPRVGSCSNR